MVTTVTGTKGKNGKSNAHPTDGTDGGDATFTQNGAITPTIPNILAKGGNGGNGGSNTAGNGNGANGGNGGNASVTMNGNILQPTTTSAVFSGASTGGDGGTGGNGFGTGTAGTNGNGGNATVTMNGNILQPNHTMTTMEIDALAVGGSGATDGNATATLSGNIIQGTATTATIHASATTDDPNDSTAQDGNAAFGTKTTNVNGNIVSGKINNVVLNSNFSASPNYSNSTANLDGNIVSTTAATSGNVTLEAAGQHIDIEQNKVNLGGTQSMNLTIDELAPAYDATIKGNDFEGTGSSAFVFTDNGVPGPSLTPDTVTIDLGNNNFMFDGKNNKLKGFSSATVNGNNVNATLIGTAGNDILIGGGGNDTFIATTGTDTYNGGGGSNTVSYANGTGPNGVTVNLGLEPAQQPIGGGFGPDTLISIQNVIGTNFNDTLTAGADTSTLNGGLGDDLLVVGTGADTLIGGGGSDTASFANFVTGVNISLLVAAPQSDGPGSVTLNGISNLTGGSGNDTLTAGAGTSILNGGLGNDTLVAGTGTDTLIGGGGSDTASFANFTTGVNISLLVAGSQSDGPGSVTLSGISNLTGGSGNDTLTAGTGTSTLNGGLGDDTLVVGTGADTLIGGGGNDTASFANFSTGVNISLLAVGPQSDGPGSVNLSGISNLTGGSGNDTLTAGTGTSTLNGGLGDDTLVVGTGTDTLIGGGGNDTASFANFATGVNISLLVAGPQSDGPGSVTLSGISNLTGGSGNDTLTAGLGAGTLIGGAGNDTLIGNGTNTTASFIDSAAGVTASLLTGIATGDGNDTLTNISYLTGSNFNDFLTGNGIATTLNGGAGNDILFGDGGSNTLIGGAGTDVAYYTGEETQYGTVSLTSVVGNGSNDNLSQIERLKFLSPSHVMDVNDDGAGDLIFQNATNGKVQVTTLGGVPANNTLAPAIGGTWTAIGTGQFTPDAAGTAARSSGILLQDSVTNGLEVLTGINGTAATKTVLSATPAAGFKAISTGDFNGDAASDVLLWNSGTSTAEIMFLNGTAGAPVGTVDATTALASTPGAGFVPFAVGDFNGDGKSDIVWYNSAANQFAIDLMNGANIIGSPIIGPGTAGLTLVGTGDFNGDGQSDLLFKDNTTGAADIWVMNNGVFTGTDPAIAKPGAAYVLTGSEDVDHNGVSDLIWRNTTNGNVFIDTLNSSGAVIAAGPALSGSLTPAATVNILASTGGG